LDVKPLPPRGAKLAKPGDVLITGASRGFGREVAVGLASRGWRVFATMRDPSARGGLDQALNAAGAPATRVSVLPLDVRDQRSVENAVTETLTRTEGQLDAVVANAGIFVAGAFEETPAEVLREVMETNYFGVLATVRATLPALRVGGGRIVLMSSDSGLCGTPGMSAYTASKYALEGWGESLAYELRPLGVALSIVEPGPFRTDIFNDPSVYCAPTAGPYTALAEATESSLLRMRETAPAPEPVVAAVVKALTARRPRLRYPVGREARVISACRGILPERAFGAVVQAATRAPTRPSLR
jgi:NAD(P)-dependent dehydrogenase (short-subunit alcohol dehydrogenase family)